MIAMLGTMALIALLARFAAAAIRFHLDATRAATVLDVIAAAFALIAVTAWLWVLPTMARGGY